MEYKFILAQSAPQAQGPQWLILILLFVGMWFLLIAPQRKREKLRKEMLAKTKVGDEIITIGGIYGTITNKTEKTYTLKVADSTKIEILISAVNENITQQATLPTKK